MKKDPLGKFDGKPLQIRFTPQIKAKIEAKALESRTSVSEVIRQACMSYFDRSMSDSEIIHAALAENSRKLRYVERKIDLLALIVLQQTKNLIKTLPNRQSVDTGIAEKLYDEFLAECSRSFKSNHGGLLESMVLDIYEQNTADPEKKQ